MACPHFVKKYFGVYAIPNFWPGFTSVGWRLYTAVVEKKYGYSKRHVSLWSLVSWGAGQGFALVQVPAHHKAVTKEDNGSMHVLLFFVSVFKQKKK